MIRIRLAGDRGRYDHGWLDTRHSFSFADYVDPEAMGFRSLRVLNEDFIQPGQGFGTHPHRDMEIITYVLEGVLEHRDSMGNGSMIRVGEVQRMSAGTGITHSESNPSKTERVHLLQIWLLPERKGITPGYEQREYPDEEKRGRLRLVASPDGADGSVRIHQDARLFASILGPREGVAHPLQAGRHAWVQVARGSITVNHRLLRQGDGAAVSEEPSVALSGVEAAETLLFDLA
jgi:redox-sensitive bicupin YhaK (pirin superfamily)